MDEVVDAVRASKGKLEAVMVVGLGSGSLACQRTPGEHWTYFEIDPVVIRIARDQIQIPFPAANARRLRRSCSAMRA